MRSTYMAIGLATWVAGILDIAWAMAGAIAAKKPVVGMLQGIASGPFREPERTMGLTGALVGVGVHFVLMLIIVMVYVRTARLIPYVLHRPWRCGALYGLAVYIVIYWIVLPQRWPAAFPQTGFGDIASAVFAHVALVGLPISLITTRMLRGAPVRPA